jgi:hypothetical protein
MNAYRIIRNARILWQVKGLRSAARYVARNII